MLRSELAMTLLPAVWPWLRARAAHAELKIGMGKFDALWAAIPQSKAMQQALRDGIATARARFEQPAKGFKTKLERFQRDSAVMTERRKLSWSANCAKGQREIRTQG